MKQFNIENHEPSILPEGEWTLAWADEFDGDIVFKQIEKDGKFYSCQLQTGENWWSSFWLQSPNIGSTPDPARSGVEIDIMETFAGNTYILCGQRVKRKLSQRELADQLGVSDKAVSKLENGRSKPKSATLYKLAAIFGISVEELISCGRKVGLSPTMQNDIKSFALPDDQITDNGGLNERGMNVSFIPEKSILGYDCICSWSLQLKIAKRLGIAGEGCSEQRDVLTDELLFGKTNYYHGYPADIREGLIFVLDDGWDVPFGTKNLRGDPNVYGRCDPDPEKFADYGETPDERLKTLSDKFKSLGYAGLGLWISPQMSGKSGEPVPTHEEAHEYWIERAKWCAHAGIRYFKIDWGAHALKVGAHAEPIGIFGSFNSLTLDYSEPIGNKRVFAQDMLADTAFDITESA